MKNNLSDIKPRIFNQQFLYGKGQIR